MRRRHDPWYAVVNERVLPTRWVETALAELKF